jgi:hypothetical protein
LQVQDQQTDGNQKNVVNNSLKYLCEGLKQNDIAAFSYDKRVCSNILRTLNEATLSFEDFINDAKAVFTYFKTKKKYNNNHCRSYEGSPHRHDCCQIMLMPLFLLPVLEELLMLL